jgi:hypothetical protein
MIKSELIKRLEKLVKEWQEPTGWQIVEDNSEMREYLHGKEAASKDLALDLQDLIIEAKE